MDDLVLRPANITAVRPGVAIRMSFTEYPATAIKQELAVRIGLAGEIVAAANDNAVSPGIEALVSCSALFWLELIEVDGHVLLAANFDGDVDGFRATRRKHGAQEAELAVNTVFLDELFDTSKYSEDRLITFGTVICTSLRARAAQVFPDRSFVTELFSADDGARLGVRLYQDIAGKRPAGQGNGI